LAADAVHDVAAGNAKSRYCLRAVALSARRATATAGTTALCHAAAIVVSGLDPRVPPPAQRAGVAEGNQRHRHAVAFVVSSVERVPFRRQQNAPNCSA
jgi:hypothetical protein